MSSTLQRLVKKKCLNPPKFLVTSVQMEVVMGSVALYLSCTLPHKPNEHAIRQLLLNCLEHHYGSLDGCVNARNDEGTKAVRKLEEISNIINR